MTTGFLRHDDMTKPCSICGKYTPASDPDNEIVHCGLDPDQRYVHCGACVRKLRQITQKQSGTASMAVFMPETNTPYSVTIANDLKQIIIASAHPMLYVTPDNFRDAIARVLEKMKGAD